MATVDQARKAIVLDEADYAVLDELVAAGIRRGLIKTTSPASRGRRAGKGALGDGLDVSRAARRAATEVNG